MRQLLSTKLGLSAGLCALSILPAMAQNLAAYTTNPYSGGQNANDVVAATACDSNDNILVLSSQNTAAATVVTVAKVTVYGNITLTVDHSFAPSSKPSCITSDANGNIYFGVNEHQSNGTTRGQLMKISNDGLVTLEKSFISNSRTASDYILSMFADSTTSKIYLALRAGTSPTTYQFNEVALSLTNGNTVLNKFDAQINPQAASFDEEDHCYVSGIDNLAAPNGGPRACEYDGTSTRMFTKTAANTASVSHVFYLRPNYTIPNSFLIDQTTFPLGKAFECQALSTNGTLQATSATFLGTYRDLVAATNGIYFSYYTGLTPLPGTTHLARVIYFDFSTAFDKQVQIDAVQVDGLDDCYVVMYYAPKGTVAVKKYDATGASLSVVVGKTIAGKTLTVANFGPYIPHGEEGEMGLVLSVQGSPYNEVAVERVLDNPALKSILMPATIVGGQAIPTTADLWFSPNGGAVVNFVSDNSNAINDSDFFLPQGTTTYPGSLFSGGVAVPTLVHWSAECDDLRIDGTITVLPASIATVVLSPNPVQGGQNANATISYNGQMPPTASTIKMTSDHPTVIANLNYPVPANDVAPTVVPLNPAPVASSTVVKLTFQLGNQAPITKTITITH